MLPDLPRGFALYPVDLGLSLGEFERQIMAESIEVSGAFDQEGRLVLRPRSGSIDKVGYAESEASLLKNNVVTHNHPNGSLLSAADAVFAAERDVAELHAVCPDGTLYGIVRSPGGWPSSDKMERAVEESIAEERRMAASAQQAEATRIDEAERRRVRFESRKRMFARLGVSLTRSNVWEA